MKRGLKALAVLAAVAVAVAGPDAFAVCSEFGGFAVFQCADLGYFDSTPVGAGSVSAVFWQIGFGNTTLNSGLGSAGTGNSGATTFNGNDNGLFTPDLVNALSKLGGSVPPGALCLQNNNWGNSGVDGCCDDFRDTSLAGGTGDDGILNPEYDVYFARNGYPGVPSADWKTDYPMGALLRESTGHWFAVAAVGTSPRTGPTDVRVGDYNFKNVTNGTPNAFAPHAPNVIPWQRIPGDRVASDPSTNLVRNSAFADPNDKLHSNRVLDIAWNAAVMYSDGSVNLSTNSTIANPGHGVGVADQGSLIRYVVETQGIVAPADPYGSLNPAGWSAVATVNPPDANTQITVPPDTCVRLHTFFGKSNTVSGGGQTVANCRLGKCGDLGYDVVSAPACIGGPLVTDGRLDDTVATRRSGKVTLAFSTQHELSVRGFDIYAVGKKGTEKIGTLPCKECTSGLGSRYTFSVESSKLKGARSFEVEVLGTGAKFKVAIH